MSAAKSLWKMTGGPLSTADAPAPQTAAIVGMRLAVGISAAFGASALFAWIWDRVADRNSDTTQFDRTVSFWMHAHQTPWLTALAIVLAGAGSTGAMAFIAVAGAAAGIARPQIRGMAWTLPLAVLGATGLILAAKGIFHRPRPTFFTPLLHAAGYSFPSGHSLFAMAIYGLLGYFALFGCRTRLRRIMLAGATALFILLIGLSRVYVGVHYPTDVLAGWTAGIPWLVTCIGIHEAVTRRFHQTGQPVISD